jgi:CDP-diacylglycerol--serine O-phosphatidyltransferase
MLDYSHERAVQKNRVRRRGIYILPNLFTLAALFFGFYAIVQAMNLNFDQAAIGIFVAMVLDSLDGRVARLTKTQSAFGLQIDSLADVVSFGVAPALLVYQWSLSQAGPVGLVCSFLFVGAGAVRLARFNVLSMGENGTPTKPGKYVVGLVIPGAAGILVSLVLANHAIAGNLRGPQFVWPLAALTVVLSVLMVSNIKFRSFKELKFNARTVAFVLFIITSSAIISLQTRPAFVLTWLLACYILLALVEYFVGIPRARRERGTGRSSSIPPQ